jgi:diguanylate cyclase (GGDEF)-like protein/PAS domain S-box-containing protein
MIPRLPRVVTGAAVAVVVLYVLQTAVPFADGALYDAVQDWGRLALFVAAAVGCAVRVARSDRDRAAWSLLTAGIATFAAGSLVWIVGGDAPPLVSSALWLSFSVFAYVAVVLLLRSQVRPFHVGFWVDGVIGLLALGAATATVFVPTLLRGVPDDTVVFVVAARPVGDAMLLATVAWALTLTGPRSGRMWLSLTAAVGVFAIADLVLVVEIGRGDALGTVARTLITACFPIAFLLIAYAGFLRPGPRRSVRMDSPIVLVLPTAYVALALGLLVADRFRAVPASAFLLAIGAVVLGFGRAMVTVLALARLHESRRFEQGFQEAAVGMALVSTDLDFQKVNAALCALLGRRPEELIGTSVLAVTHHDDHAATHEFVAHREGRLEKRMLRPDGSQVEVSLTTSMIGSEDGEHYFTQFDDRTAHNQADRRTAATLELNRRAIEISDVPLLIHEAVALMAEVLATPYCLVVRDGGKGYLVPEATASESSPRRVPSGEGSMTGYAMMHAEPVLSDDLVAETRFAYPEGVRMLGLRRGMAVPVRRRGAVSYAVGAFRVESEPPFTEDDLLFLEAVGHTLASAIDRAELETQTRHASLHDPLTGLANRAFLGAHLEQALGATAREGGTVSLLLLDVDRFKLVNDALGHTAGDELLVQVAQRLRAIVRDYDVVARLGGDEFVIACPRMSEPREVVMLAQRLVDAFAQPFTAGTREWHLGASIGVARSVRGTTAEDLLRDADLAMYRAKDRGGSRFEVFDADLRERVMDRMSLEVALRAAVDADELVLHYQPIVDLATGALEGFEALLRWQHPERGLVGPAEFIPIAEDTDLILPIGHWVLRTACAQLAAWNVLAPGRSLHVRANLSPRQITPALAATVARAIADSGIDAHQLGLEITERLLIEEPSASAILEEVRALGVSVALDDFGTGYSSLSYLKSYPVDVLKLDRSLVAELGTAPEATAIVKAAVDMAAALGLRVVGEGIEVETQARILRTLGCPLGQGFLFAPPLPAEDVEELVVRDAAFA